MTDWLIARFFGGGVIVTMQGNNEMDYDNWSIDKLMVSVVGFSSGGVLVAVQGNNEVGCWNLESGSRHQVIKK